MEDGYFWEGISLGGSATETPWPNCVLALLFLAPKVYCVSGIYLHSLCSLHCIVSLHSRIVSLHCTASSPWPCTPSLQHILSLHSICSPIISNSGNLQRYRNDKTWGSSVQMQVKILKKKKAWVRKNLALLKKRCVAMLPFFKGRLYKWCPNEPLLQIYL
jgi:hypothetical protein